MNNLNQIIIEGKVIDSKLETACSPAKNTIKITNTRQYNSVNSEGKKIETSEDFSIHIICYGNMAVDVELKLKSFKSIRVVGRLGYSDNETVIIAEHIDFKE